MMLPILISVSVAPVSYFFCATADTEAAAMISMESPSVVMRSLAQRFIEFSSQRVLRKSGYGFCEQSTRALLEFSISSGVTAFCLTACSAFVSRRPDDSRGGRLPEAGWKQQPVEGRYVA